MFGGQPIQYAAKFYDDTLTCYSFSKSLSLPGERIGYVAVNPRATDAELIVPMCGQISRGTGHNLPVLPDPDGGGALPCGDERSVCL